MIRNLDISKLDILCQGHECVVYVLNKDLVLKIFNGKDNYKSVEILNNLQGVPFIPKTYDYCKDGKWLIQQRIKGVTMAFYNNGLSFFTTNYDYGEHEKKVNEFWEKCIEKGYLPRDLQNGNLMIDEKGDFWVVDVGQFGMPAGEYTFERKNKNSNYNGLLSAGKDMYLRNPRIQQMIDMLGKKRMYELSYPLFRGARDEYEANYENPEQLHNTVKAKTLDEIIQDLEKEVYGGVKGEGNQKHAD